MPGYLHAWDLIWRPVRAPAEAGGPVAACLAVPLEPLAQDAEELQGEADAAAGWPSSSMIFWSLQERWFLSTTL